MVNLSGMSNRVYNANNKFSCIFMCSGEESSPLGLISILRVTGREEMEEKKKTKRKRRGRERAIVVGLQPSMLGF